jgi:arylsulfatase A-like enzyme
LELLARPVGGAEWPSMWTYIARFGLILCLLAVAGCAPPAEDIVVVLLVDTVRVDALGCYGNPLGPTEHIDALAEEGVRFDQAISSSGWTLPSVATLLTGTWPTIHGASGRNVTLTRIHDELPTAAEVFRRHGFHTSAFANAAFVSPMLGVARGFDHFDHHHTYNRDTRRADATVDAALAHLEKNRVKRNFVLVHFFDAHLDYDPPAGYTFRYTGGRREPAPPLTKKMCLEMSVDGGRTPPRQEDIDYVRSIYQAEVSFLDAQVGRLVRALKEWGLYDRATIVLVADHGEEFWEHGGFEHGHSLFDELVRVPLIVKFPSGTEPARRVVSEQVRVLDVMPTVFSLYGIEPPETFVGRSLLPLVRGEEEEPRAAFSESLLFGPDAIAWRGPRYKYIHYLVRGSRGTCELYDWREDPAEQVDLSEARPEVVRELRAELLEFWGKLREKAQAYPEPEVVDLSPTRIRQLRSLGYVQ